MDQDVLKELKTYQVTFVKLLSVALEEKNKDYKKKHRKNIVSPLDSLTTLICWDKFLGEIEVRFGPSPVLGKGLDAWWVYCFFGLMLFDEKSAENNKLGNYAEQEWFMTFANVIKFLIGKQNGKPINEPNFGLILWGFCHGLEPSSNLNRFNDIGIRAHCLYINIVPRLNKL